ncbi:MAG: T9SS type A sorting domain-containing protein [Bacteroidetes bacterium]|nr:T9SS type A sorting domain-containing protein [Bacteroidota bacterium]
MQRTLLGTALLLAFMGAARLAAQTDVATKLPWNGYAAVQIISGNFSSIIGRPGTTRIVGSELAGYGGAVLPLSFSGFDIGFLQHVYTAPVSMKVSTSGWISFNGSAGTLNSPTPELRYTTMGTAPYYNKVLMAYWGELVTAGVDSGGIYWRADTATVVVDGTSHLLRYLAVEWCARYANDPAAPVGRFQARIYERIGAASNSMIDLYYGPTSIDLPKSTDVLFNYGAQVGIRNFGQAAGNPDTVGDPYDQEKVLVIGHPVQLPALATHAITRLRTMAVVSGSGTTPYTPEWYAFYSRFVPPSTEMSSAYFHYSFPPVQGGGRVAYRMKPVAVDMGASVVTTNGLDASVPNSFGGGTQILPQGTFANLGATTLSDVPIRIYLYAFDKNGLRPNPLDSFVTAIPTINPGETVKIDIWRKDGISQRLPGLYRLRAIVQAPNDENHSNDTTHGDFIISTAHDLQARRIVQPLPSTEPFYTMYQVGDAIPFVVQFRNTGTNEASGVNVGYEVRDADLKLVHTGTGTIDKLAALDSNSFTFFDDWRPSGPGRFYMRGFVQDADDISQDDTVPAYPGVPFDVAYAVDLAAGTPVQPQEPHFPASNHAYPAGQQLPVLASVANNGSAGIRQSPVTVEITSPKGVSVYRQTVNSDFLAFGGATVPVNFPPYTPTELGTYTITAWVLAPNDAVASNDTARWTFTAYGPGSVERSTSHAGYTLAAYPNPLTGESVVFIDVPAARPVEVALYDILGRRVTTLFSGVCHGTEIARIPADDLPTGMYVIRMDGAEGVLSSAKVTVAR